VQVHQSRLKTRIARSPHTLSWITRSREASLRFYYRSIVHRRLLFLFCEVPHRPRLDGQPHMDRWPSLVATLLLYDSTGTVCKCHYSQSMHLIDPNYFNFQSSNYFRVSWCLDFFLREDVLIFLIAWRFGCIYWVISRELDNQDQASNCPNSKKSCDGSLCQHERP
jgi:hypothetical protein